MASWFFFENQYSLCLGFLLTIGRKCRRDFREQFHTVVAAVYRRHPAPGSQELRLRTGKKRSGRKTVGPSSTQPSVISRSQGHETTPVLGERLHPIRRTRVLLARAPRPRPTPRRLLLARFLTHMP